MAEFKPFIDVLLDGSKDIEVSGSGNGFQNNEKTKETKSCGKQVGTVWGVTAQEWEKIYPKVTGTKSCISSEWLKNEAKKEDAINYHFIPNVWEKCGFSKIKSQYVANILADVFVQSYTRSFLNARVALNKMGEKFSENSTMINSALIEAINRHSDTKENEDLLIKLLKAEREKDGWGKRINKYPNRPGATNIYGTCKTKTNGLIQSFVLAKVGDIDADCSEEEAAEYARTHQKGANVVSQFFSRVKGGLDFSTPLWKQDIAYTIAFTAILGGLGFVFYRYILK